MPVPVSESACKCLGFFYSIAGVVFFCVVRPCVGLYRFAVLCCYSKLLVLLLAQPVRNEFVCLFMYVSTVCHVLLLLYCLTKYLGCGLCQLCCVLQGLC